nr:tRNA (N(6)-L-threonylcarbamoyladenosine(37)-C(2))-methylthiotransferase MtaB [Lichenihabitans psoromatis]
MTAIDGDARSRASVEVVTFGCRLNIVESDAMRSSASRAGHANLAIVNTCAVTAEAVRQARQSIRRLARDNPERPIVVTGCASAIDPDGFSAMPEVSHVVANSTKTALATWSGLPRTQATASNVRGLAAPIETIHTRGFLEIQNGCDHRCTFCVIPFGRGASRSIAPATILERARTMLENGIREIVLTGVDITSYGSDLPDEPKLGTLVRTLLAALPDLPRLRLSSIDCIEADSDLITVIADEDRFMPHLHLSLQSGSDLILKRMKRRHGRGDAVAFCQKLKALRPDMVFGADIITGFPTETEAHFADSVALIEDCGLTHLHVFPYSPRPGTPATRMPQVPRDTARERAAALRAVGDAALHRHLAAKIGRTTVVLMERGGKGREADFTGVRVGAPTDTAAVVPRAGSFVPVLITGHDGRNLAGVPLDP